MGRNIACVFCMLGSASTVKGTDSVRSGGQTMGLLRNSVVCEVEADWDLSAVDVVKIGHVRTPGLVEP